jgi:hypothetical protein
MSYSYNDEDHAETTRPAAKTIWIRGLIMLLFIVLFGVVQSVLYLIAIIQFIWMAVTGERNAFIADFGRPLALWLADTARFLTAESEDKPFPWRSWPTS